ncbi:atypical membrane-integrating protein (Mistic protein) [Cytobacillus suaedae]|nr:atypical membrane-integrating protein (Mistic protein) [Cytobacillus suaedae]
MKLNEKEKQKLSESIDRMNEALDVFIEYYNESEEDKPLIEFEPEVIEAIEKAKSSYGEEETTKRINTIIKEVLSFIPKNEAE